MNCCCFIPFSLLPLSYVDDYRRDIFTCCEIFNTLLNRVNCGVKCFGRYAGYRTEVILHFTKYVWIFYLRAVGISITTLICNTAGTSRRLSAIRVYIRWFILLAVVVPGVLSLYIGECWSTPAQRDTALGAIAVASDGVFLLFVASSTRKQLILSGISHHTANVRHATDYVPDIQQRWCREP